LNLILVDLGRQMDQISQKIAKASQEAFAKEKNKSNKNSFY
jgi:hypothetical protein